MRSQFKRRGSFLALLIVFALVVAACGNGAEETTTTTEADAPMVGTGYKIGMAYDVGGRGDKSFNDSAAAGLDLAVAELGVEATELEPAAGGEDREENLRLLAEAGNDLVFGIGFAFGAAIESAAADFPDTQFAIVDSVVEAPNVASLVFAEHEGSALVGAAAALKTQTNTIGFIGGVAGLGLIEKFQAGFEFGAREINPDIEIIVQYLTEFPDFAGFNDPARGKEAALAMFEGGADVVYHAAGGSGAGLFEAAKETSEATGTKVWAIGVDSDQYYTASPDVKDYILTSMIKRVDVAVFTTTYNLVTGTEQSGKVLFDLAKDGVGFSTSGGFIDDIKDQLDELRLKIIAGDLVVPEVPTG